MDNADALACFEAFLRRRFPDRRTAVDYVSDIRQFQGQCPQPWDTVTVQDIDAFVMHMQQAGLKPTTIKRRVAALKVYFDVLADEEGPPDYRNPVRSKRHAPKLGQRLPRDLRDAEVAHLCSVVTSPRDQALIALMLHAGLRVGEVVTATRDALLLPSSPDAPGRLRVRGKGQKERMVYLNQQTVAALNVWLAQCPAGPTATIFCNERGRPLTTSGVEWLLTAYGRQIGLHLTPHRLRHTFARRLTEAHMPVESLARLLGHNQISTTQIYLAGADPQVRLDFERAMRDLASPSVPLPIAPPVPPRCAGAAPAGVRPPAPSYPPPDDGATWACDLPDSIRQPCLSYVQRHLGGWRPSQRRRTARDTLHALARFFRSVCAQHPLTEMSALSRADVQGYVDGLIARGVTAAGIRRSLSRILGFLHELDEQGVPIAAAIWRMRLPPRPESVPRTLAEEDIQRLEAVARHGLSEGTRPSVTDAACFFLLAHSGLRACEVLDLCQDDVDLSHRRVWVRGGKGARDRVVYLTEVAAAAIQQYLDLCPHPDVALLVVDEQGEARNNAWLCARLRCMATSAGVVERVTPHRLRHTFATRLINAQVPITSVQKLLGHDHLNTTQIYAHVYDSTVEQDYRRAMAEIESTPPLALPMELFQGERRPRHSQSAVKVLDNSV